MRKRALSREAGAGGEGLKSLADKRLGSLSFTLALISWCDQGQTQGPKAEGCEDETKRPGDDAQISADR